MASETNFEVPCLSEEGWNIRNGITDPERDRYTETTAQSIQLQPYSGTMVTGYACAREGCEFQCGWAFGNKPISLGRCVLRIAENDA